MLYIDLSFTRMPKKYFNFLPLIAGIILSCEPSESKKGKKYPDGRWESKKTTITKKYPDGRTEIIEYHNCDAPEMRQSPTQLKPENQQAIGEPQQLFAEGHDQSMNDYVCDSVGDNNIVSEEEIEIVSVLNKLQDATRNSEQCYYKVSKAIQENSQWFKQNQNLCEEFIAGLHYLCNELLLSLKINSELKKLTEFDINEVIEKAHIDIWPAMNEEFRQAYVELVGPIFEILAPFVERHIPNKVLERHEDEIFDGFSKIAASLLSSDTGLNAIISDILWACKMPQYEEILC